MKRIIPSAILLLVIFFTANVSCARENLVDRRRHTLTCTLEFTNTFASAVSLTVKTPIPLSDPPRQEILSVSSAPKGSCGAENSSMKFNFSGIGKGRQKLCTVTTILQNTRKVIDVDISSVPERQTIPPRLQPYLTPSATFPCDDRDIRARTEQIVGAESHPYFRVVRLYDHVRAFTFQLQGKPRTAKQALETKVVQCSDAAVLLVTLCRAAGIPARYCAGVYMAAEKDGTADTHAWCEAWVQTLGWVPLDPTMGRFDESTRLSRLAELHGEYALLWRDSPEGFFASVTQPPGLGAAESHFHVRFAYRPASVSRGASWPQFPAFTIPSTVPPSSTALMSSAHPQVKDLLSRGVALIRQKRYREAETVIRQAIALDPGLWIAHRQLVEATFQGRRADLFVKEYAALAQKSPRNAIYPYALGCIELLRNDYSAAQRFFTASISLGGDNFLVHHGLGSLALTTKQLTLAYRSMRRAVELCPQSPSTLRNLVDFYLYLEDWAAAVSMSDQAYALTGNDIYLTDSGQALMKAGEPRRALPYFQRAVSLRPGDGTSRALQGWCRLALGDRKRARDDLRAALRLGGFTPREKEYYQELLKKAEK